MRSVRSWLFEYDHNEIGLLFNYSTLILFPNRIVHSGIEVSSSCEAINLHN